MADENEGQTPGPKKTKTLKKPAAVERAQLARFVPLLARGFTKDEIIEEMGLHPSTFEALFSQYFESLENESTTKSPVRLFVEFITRQNQLVKDLEGLKEALQGQRYKNGQAYVAAVRTQSEIFDKLIKTGQDLGIVVKTPEQVLIVGGRDARDLDPDELELEVKKKMEETRKLLNRRGDKPSGGKVVAFRRPEESR